VAKVVLRIMLLSGNHLDVVYDEPGTPDPVEVGEHAVGLLGRDDAVLFAAHGGRTVAVFSRGVAAVEVDPRGAVL
jgi:hypothetical protein